MDQKILNEFLDLLANHLMAPKSDRKLIEICARFLLLILDSQPLQLEFLKSRQKNLPKVLQNLPKNKEMELLEFYLETETVADFELHRRHQAAAKIQAAWKGYHTRSRLAKAYAGFRTLQSFYRSENFNGFLSNIVAVKNFNIYDTI